MKFGLRGIRGLMQFLDNPERQFPSIHIAGTNGKGSTASMIAAIFTAAGYTTALYTSPHLISFNERIRINGSPIPSRIVARLATLLRKEVERNQNTFFEATTAIAFKYFAEKKVDIAIVETGLGGRLDATNVLRPIVSIITTLGLEHTQILGTRLEDIAYEKGGIIKRGIPCITGVRSRRAVRVLQEICNRKQTDLIRIDPKHVRIRRASLERTEADFFVSGRHLNRVKVSLAGRHQIQNALLALSAIARVIERGPFRIDQKAIRAGLGNIQKYSGLQGRLSVARRNPLVLIDVAHNSDAVHALCSSLRYLYPGKVNIVFGLMQDKDYKQIIKMLRNISHCVFVVEPRTERSRAAADLATEFRRSRIVAEEHTSVARGIAAALRKPHNVPLLITGSHFVVGEALASFTKKKYLTINQ